MKERTIMDKWEERLNNDIEKYHKNKKKNKHIINFYIYDNIIMFLYDCPIIYNRFSCITKYFNKY